MLPDRPAPLLFMAEPESAMAGFRCECGSRHPRSSPGANIREVRTGRDTTLPGLGEVDTLPGNAFIVPHQQAKAFHAVRGAPRRFKHLHPQEGRGAADQARRHRRPRRLRAPLPIWAMPKGQGPDAWNASRRARRHGVAFSGQAPHEVPRTVFIRGPNRNVRLTLMRDSRRLLEAAAAAMRDPAHLTGGNRRQPRETTASVCARSSHREPHRVAVPSRRCAPLPCRALGDPFQGPYMAFSAPGCSTE